jgi:hypothetical protein
LANKHGIFDHQSVVPSPKEMNDTNNDSNIQHPFTVISTLINNDHDDLSSSSPTPSSNLIQNPDEHENELGSLRHHMNGVLSGDGNNSNHNEDDDEQDGTSSTNPLINLPQQIASILCNDNINLNNIKTDDDQLVITTNSPTNNLDFQSQQSSSTTPNLSRQSSTKLLEDFCDICQKHFCNKYYLRVSFYKIFNSLFCKA